MEYVDKAGTYECEVVRPVSGWFGEQGEKKTPFIRVPCVVTSGPQEGKAITWMGWLSDGAADNTIRQLARTFPGWNGDLVDLDEGKFTFEGLNCQIAAEAETWDGKTRIKAKWLNPPGGGAVAKPLEAGKVASLLKRLGGKSRALVKAERAANPAPAGSDGQIDSDDDIPF